MPIVAETLTVINRNNPSSGELELLVGVQKRGEWQGVFNFPGGKAETGEMLSAAASRELREETGITIPEDRLQRIGTLLITDLRPALFRFGSVAIFAAHVENNIKLRPNEDEFDCLWINPRDRHVLLSMPSDVKYWLPLVYKEPRQQFTCFRTIGENGGNSFTTVIDLPGQQHVEVNEESFNL